MIALTPPGLKLTYSPKYNIYAYVKIERTWHDDMFDTLLG